MTPDPTPGLTAAALAALHAAAGMPEPPWDEAGWAAMLAMPGAVALGDGRAAILGRVAADEAEVLMVLTHPAHRRRGLARALLALLEAEAARRGARRGFLEVAEDNAGARALYALAGWGEVGRRRGYYARPGGRAADALALGKPLG